MKAALSLQKDGSAPGTLKDGPEPWPPLMYKFDVAQFQRPPPVAQRSLAVVGLPAHLGKVNSVYKRSPVRARGENKKVVAPPQVRTGGPVRGQIRTTGSKQTWAPVPGFVAGYLPPTGGGG